MKINLNLLNRVNEEEYDLDIDVNLFDISKTEIIKLNFVHFSGRAFIDFVDDLILEGTLSGEMILPCSLTLEEVEYSFQVEIEENLGNFDEILKNNKNSLEILSILCENIVLEIPMKVVKKGIDISHMSGEGWELSDN